MQTQLLLPLLGSVRRVFKKMFDSDAAVGSPAVLRAWVDRSDGVDVCLPVEGAQQGAFVLSASSSSADAIVAELLASRDIPDAATARRGALLEFARMVCNIARRDQRAAGIRFLPPTTYEPCTDGEMLTRLRPWIVIPITTRFGDISLAASLRADPSGTQSTNPPAATPQVGSPG